MARLRPAPVSILSRVFTVNAVVFGLAVLLLIVSPVTVSYPAKLTQITVVGVGLLMTFVVDLLLLAAVLSPLHKLVKLMADIDPMRPGQRAQVSDWDSTEVIALARALNSMLDRVETERRESARRALAAQESERLRIARELHDEVGQTLTAIALQAERAVGDRAAETRSLADIVLAIHHSLEDVRRIARELRPEALDDLGLVDALISLCVRIERQSVLRVVREMEGDLPSMTSEVELVVYRVAQEALTNALRHAEASQVRVALGRSPDGIVLSVTDDGRGLSEHVRGAGGLAGMQERALLIQAKLEISSVPGDGVEVRLRLPSTDEQQ
jgi:two-component system sensor histidine kinase UhpB